MEEPELMAMPAETVHRQEDEDEGEEHVAVMPAETVHRQEELPEELAMMPAETVHRDEEEEVEEATEEAEEVAPANPALAELFDTTVTSQLVAASVAMEGEEPDAATAHEHLYSAADAAYSLRRVYEESDPELGYRMSAFYNGLLGVATALEPLAGVAPNLEWIRRQLENLFGTASEIGPTLH
jgi:hypothetical protein